MDRIDRFKQTYGLTDVLVFPYGSRVYGTDSAKSDYDYMAVVPDGTVQTGVEYRHADTNVHVYTRSDWQAQLGLHKIHCLEAYFLPDGLCRKHFNLTLDVVKLRHELSQKASHSFVKAKKKIDVEHDYYVGWKSLFHSLRIMTFGIQIATTGKINDYGAANHIWREIIANPEYLWEPLKVRYQPLYNRLATEFRHLAPKEIKS